MKSHKPRTTHEEFIKKLDKVHPNRDWEVIGKYEFNKTPILLKDKYGECLIAPNYLLQRSVPSVKTAINKTEYTLNKFKEVWGNTYDYSEFEYKGALTKSTIICKKHGRFYQHANSHLSGRCGCLKCANESISKRVRSNTEEFIEKAVLKHGSDKYSFEKTVYVTATKDVIITCKKHGDFERTPNYFLNGQVCPRCSYANKDNYYTLKKKRNNSILYMIECYNKDERFIKIGVTSRSVKARFKDNYDMPYKYNILREFSYANVDTPDSLETHLLKLTKAAIYEPKLKFNGSTETRLFTIKDTLIELFDTYVDELNFLAFLNFIKDYSGVFDMYILNSGDYSKMEVESVMKGYEVHLKIEQLKVK